MDLLALRARLTLDKSEYEQALADAESDASSSGSSLSGVLGKVGGIAGGVIKLTAAGIAAGSAAIVALTKQSTGAYAQYEQLSGGISKLFGTAGATLEEYAAQQGKSVDEVSDKYAKLEAAQSEVFKNANQAYMTAGMSANQYMEQVSSFSAALVNSLGGDTVEAAKRADVAMRAISDNVNTFGSDVTSVQMAFQGFAKQNYTMLDNLKLGYGGTKSEMERLIADANEYAKATGQAADLSIDSFADIVQAIELIQEKQNIAGTTAREAASTVEGSLNMLKGSWENLIAGLANPDADLGALIDNVVSSAETAFGNLMPVIERSVEGIGRLVTDVAPMLLDRLPGIISEITPKLISAAVGLMSNIAVSIAKTIPQLTKIVPDMVSNIIPQLETGMTAAAAQVDFVHVVIPILVGLSGKIREKSGELVTAGIDIVKGIGQGIESGGSTLSIPIQTIFSNMLGAITDNIPLLFKAGLELLNGLGEGIGENLPSFLENTALPMLLQFSEFVREGAGQLVDTGIDFILNLAQGIMDSLPTLIEQVPQIIINFAGAINDNAPKLIVGGVKLIGMVINGIISAIPTLIANIPQIFQAILAVWSALNWINLGKNVITFIKNGIEQLQTQVPQAIKDIGTKAIEWFKGVNWATAGKDAVNFIRTAITGLASLIPNALRSIGSAAVSAFKSIDWWDVGSNVIKGIVNGISSGIGWIKDAAKEAAQSALNAAKNLLGIESPSKVFRDQVGKMIPAGLSIGIDEGAIDAIDSAKRLSENIFKPFDDLDTPTVGITTGSDYTNMFTQDFGSVMAEFIRANNDALAEALYMAFLMAMRDGGFTMQIDGREFGRILRENGVQMA